MSIKTMKGHTVDMARLIAKNENVIAIGGASMNARGDVIGPRGQIVKSREEVAAEYHRTSAGPVKQVPLRDLAEDVFAPAPRKAAPASDEQTFLSPAEAAAASFAPPKPAAPKRKITDSED
jgi:hypothetical protein